MKGFTTLWKDAGKVVGRAWKEADARTFGTQRATGVYGALNQPERDAMRDEVVSQFGETAWDDFVRRVDGRQ